MSSDMSSHLLSVTLPKSITDIAESAFAGCDAIVDVTIPGGFRMSSVFPEAYQSITNAVIAYGTTNVVDKAFYGCSGLTSVTIPDSVTSIGQYAFGGCTSLADGNGLIVINDVLYGYVGTGGDVTIPDSVTSIGQYAFLDCSGLTSVIIPDSVTNIGDSAFSGCNSLTSVTILDSVQTLASSAFDGCDRLWTSWYRTLANLVANSGNQSGGSTGSASSERITLVTTNIVIHYVTQSVPSNAVIPPMESGIVNVVAEVGAGSAVAISSDWAAQYPGFTEKFGNDFGAAITAQTGKRDGSGNPMFVWQDFVAGTDPTDSNDVFTASITFDATTGEPVVSWSPELSAAEAAKRSYTTYGKVRLTDPDWTPIDGDEADYNFFKVEVKMK